MNTGHWLNDTDRENLGSIYGRQSGTVFWPKRDEVTGGWRKLHNEELHDLYSSATIVRVITSTFSTG
jgi:hypothetical protein